MESLLAELAKTGLTTATAELIKNILKNINILKLPLQKDILEELLKPDNYSNFLAKYVSRTIKIRTIHNAERDIYLNEIYHPLRIKLSNNSNKNILVEDEFILENKNINNIIGIAGQGKSTILRKIFIEQIKHGTKIPFFIELHKAENSGILTQLELILSNCGLKITEEKITALLKSGKIMLLLDGFDEITPNNRINLMNEINNININYSTQIITTTRPDTEICHEPNIVNYNVLKLDSSDILSILKKLNSQNDNVDPDFLNIMNNGFKENHDLVSVMNLPILVTLFYICYPYLDNIPKNAVDFYSKLFTTLYLRHDKIKNLRRYKSSNLTYSDVYKCFCTLCFNALHDGVLNFNELSLNTYVEKSIKINNLQNKSISTDTLVSDFINITCLIQKDGYDTYVFLHKSIQEYHAAEFIKNLDIATKYKFYNLLLNDLLSTDRKYFKVIEFLLGIDEENVIDKILIPLCEKNGVNQWSHQELTDAKVDQFTNEIINSYTVTLRRIETDEDSSIQMRVIRLFSKSVEKYVWLNVFNTTFTSQTLFFNSFLTDLITQIIFPIEIDKTTYEKLLENGSKEINNIVDINCNAIRFLKITEQYDKLRIEMKKLMTLTYQELYISNKQKIAERNSTLETYFDFK